VPSGSTAQAWSYVDTTELPNGVDFLYFVVAQFTDGTSSGASNTKVITAVNDAPVVVSASTYTVGQGGSLTIPARGVLTGSTDTDSADASVRAVVETGPSHAATFSLNANGAFTYTPQASFAGTDTFTFHADNGIWPPGTPASANSNTATVTINVTDVTPPVVTLTIPAPNGNNGWFKTSPVTLTVTATDPSNVTAISCADGATNNLVCTATDGKGNTGAAAGSANTGSLKIDTVPPAVSITTPINNGTYVLNASVAANYGCTDSPGSGLATCAGSQANGSNISTSPVGPQTFTVTASDNAGNVATRVNTYWVVYNFVLTPPKTSANLGSAVPLIWQLTDALGAVLSDLTSLVKLTSYFTGQPSGGTCSTNYTATSTNTAVLYNPATGATGGSNFRFVSPTFQFNWDTTTATSTGKGCYVVVWQLKDNAGPGPTFSILNSSLLKKVAILLK
jgi:VCBS repeat-containing protein